MDQLLVFAIAGVIVGLIGSQLFRKSFDPFEPVWLFLIGYAHVYVVQALICREYALRVRGIDVVTQANGRALWALLWFLLVYYSGIGRRVAARLPRPPAYWSPSAILGISPLLIAWGLFCSLPRFQDSSGIASAGNENLLHQFPIMMLAAGIFLIVTGRQPGSPRPAFTWAGLAVSAGYVLLWMFNGKRSHALIGVLTAFCAYYVPRLKRPSKPMLAALAFAAALVVSVALGWRGNVRYEQSLSGFVQFLGEFRLDTILVDLNLKSAREGEMVSSEFDSKETLEYGGFLLMMDTVPDKSDYDFGSPYIRLLSTYIPRIVWQDKPVFGREQWVSAWVAGSEFSRDNTFTGPAIGILGATQLNGGAWATAIVLAVLAIMIRGSYDYFRLYAPVPWVQAWWALTYYNAWLMTVNDDPFVWFYYLYGHTTLPPLVLLWIYHKFAGGRAQWAEHDLAMRGSVDVPIWAHSR